MLAEIRKLCALFTRAALFGALPLLATTAECETSPLSKVLESRAIAQLEIETRKAQRRELRLWRHDSPWFDEQSEYGKLFTDKKHRPQLVHWLTTNLSHYQLSKITTRAFDHYLRCEAKILKSNESGEFTIKVLLPHPRYREMAEYEILREFREIVPERSMITYTEEIPFGKHMGTLYQITGGRCSLNIRAEKGALIHLLSEKCESLRELVDLGKTLDLMRFDRKLES